MTPATARLHRARRSLALAAAARAALTAALAVLLVLGAGFALDTLAGLPLGLRRAFLPLAVIAGGATLIRALAGPVRAAARATDEAVALWFESRLPTLRYALVTSVDARFAGSAPALDREIAGAPLEREVSLATRHALARPAIIVATLALGLILVPKGAIGRVIAPAPGDSLERLGAAARAAADPLASIVVRVTPPAYSGLRATSHDDPSTVTALAGSRIRIEGRGDGVRAAIGGDTIAAVASDANGWSIALQTPRAPTGVRLIGPVRERVLVIDPITDSLPGARLDQPVRDSVLREAKGQVTLSADVSDDHGLADAAFEFIVSTGAGETFTFRSGRVGARTFDAGTRRATLGATLALDTLKLAPGDLIHLRAVARDRNDVTGPGIGASETRTLRIARRDEYDSVSVDPMPPTEPEKNALSQRMILLMTEELVAKMPRLSPGATTDESRRIAKEQVRLRKRVGEVVFIRLNEAEGEHEHFDGDGHEHAPDGPVNPDALLAAAEAAANAGAERMLEAEGGDSPIVAINRPLLEAYNHMWRAATEMETVRPRDAIPWMKRAIEALQRARAAERIYLRGRPPRVVVDIAKVRGTGKERGESNARVARAPADAARAARLARFDVALGIIASDPAAAADSLLLVRLTVPEDDRATAQALDAAAEAVRRPGARLTAGGEATNAVADVTDVLARARRALAGPPVRQSALGPWGN
jgi:hypothetical protein